MDEPKQDKGAEKAFMVAAIVPDDQLGPTLRLLAKQGVVVDSVNPILTLPTKIAKAAKSRGTSTSTAFSRTTRTKERISAAVAVRQFLGSRASPFRLPEASESIRQLHTHITDGAVRQAIYKKVGSEIERVENGLFQRMTPA